MKKWFKELGFWNVGWSFTNPILTSILIPFVIGICPLAAVSSKICSEAKLAASIETEFLMEQQQQYNFLF